MIPEQIPEDGALVKFSVASEDVLAMSPEEEDAKYQEMLKYFESLPLEKALEAIRRLKHSRSEIANGEGGDSIHIIGNNHGQINIGLKARGIMGGFVEVLDEHLGRKDSAELLGEIIKVVLAKL